jgi:plastocyanin
MKKAAFALALLLAAFALAACGGDDDTNTSEPTTQAETEGGGGSTEAEGGGGAGGGGGVVEVEADPSGNLAFTTDQLTAEAGKVKVTFSNPSPIGHDADFEDASGAIVAKTNVITESSESTTGEFEPGEYTYFCSVPGHREAGMEGTLTVE